MNLPKATNINTHFEFGSSLSQLNLRRSFVTGILICVTAGLIISLFPYMQYRQDSVLNDLRTTEVSSPSSKVWAQLNPSEMQQTSLQRCGFPSIPNVSVNRESELATVRQLNEWIRCHNDWAQQLNALRIYHTKQDNMIKVNHIQSLIEDDKTTISWLNLTYAEWKRNSELQKHRLGFRRNFIDTANRD
ncbi:MAG: hypothetical protein E6Q34_01560 [Burkholderiaceae bacterium]|nr:MAG: hypothetical protein E6Q34_01560 [Burkholderiaceae bacterium]